tara:strand:- start:2229 stop:3125 length:897 start_codon:yes stop_codon:yes gene_type:complete
MTWNSYAEFYRSSDYGRFPQEHRQATGRLAARMIYVEQGPHSFSDPSVSETILALPLTVESGCSWRWKIHGRSYSALAEPGGMLVVPAEVESEWEVNGTRQILVLTVPNKTVQAVLGVSSSESIRAAFWALAESAWTDPFIEALMVRLWESLAIRHPYSNRLSDGIVTTILSHLLMRTGRNIGIEWKVSLPQWRLRRVMEFVDNNIDRPISLDQMSNAAGLSRRHFARSFAAELGLTPHKWLMRRRVDLAQRLLETTDGTLSEIAQACGFSSQSHLTSLMQQEAGVTPHRWRLLHRHS